MSEEESLLVQFKKASLIGKILTTLFIVTFLLVLQGTERNINKTVYLISLITFEIVTFFVVPLLAYKKRIKEKQLSKGLKVVLIIKVVNIIVFTIVSYRVLIANIYALDLSYYFFIGSNLLLIIIGIGLSVYTDIKDVINMDEKDKRKNKTRRLLNYINIFMGLLLLSWSTLPFVYTVSGDKDLKELKRPHSIGICRMHKNGDSSKSKDIYNKDLIDEIISKINENKIESIKGVEALNCVKRKGKLHYYMIGTFWTDDRGGLLSLDIYPDGYAVICRYCLDKSFIYKRYYKVKLSEEIIEKIINEVEK